MSKLICVVGAPSPLLHAAFALTRLMIETSLGDHTVISANSFDTLCKNYKELRKGEQRPLIVLSDYPDLSLIGALRAVKAPILVCAEGFMSIVNYGRSVRSYQPKVAARFACVALAKLELLASERQKSGLFLRDGRSAVHEQLLSMAHHFQISAADEMADLVLARIGHQGDRKVTVADYAAELVSQIAISVESNDEVNPLEREFIRALASQYDPMVSGQRVERIEWPLTFLLDPNRDGQPLVGSIDLTGPARCLYYGPYLPLPVGLWWAKVTIEVIGCRSQNALFIDVASQVLLAAIKTKIPVQGVFESIIPFQIVDPANLVEIRLHLATGAIEGHLKVRRILLIREPEIDWANEFRAAS